MHRPFNPKNILVRMPNWLGDLIMATPLLKDLRRHWPDAKITALCQGALGAVIQNDPHIDEVQTFKRPKSWLRMSEYQDITDPLRKGQYDLGILLTNSLSSAWWFWRGHVKNRIGYDTHWRRWLLDFPIPFPKTRETQHLVKTYKMLLSPLGIPLSNSDPALYLTDQEKIETKKQLTQMGITPQQFIIGINPGAAYGSAKCWLPDRFREVALKLLEFPNTAILFFGDKAGKPLVDQICQGLPNRVINLAGQTTIRGLMAFIDSCHAFLTNDSGPMHMASALGIPLVALFGSTSDVATGPYKGGTVIHKHVPCSPCYRRECPIDFRCMKSIQTTEVYEALEKLLKQ